MKEKFLEALKQLKKEEKKNFVQSADIIINLSDIDIRKVPISVFLNLPHPFRENRICAFLEAKNPSADRTITKAEIASLDKKQIKKIAKEYDFFVSSAPLMPSVAGTFGKILGPLGKMPNPKIGGVVMKEEANAVKITVEKFRKSINLKAKEPSLKASIGKESMKDEELAENAEAVYNAVVNALPNKRENVKNVMIKFTMSKPIKLELK